MRAVLIGTAAYRDNFTDLDLIADQEFVDAIRFDRISSAAGKRGTHYVFKHQEKMVEVVVPNLGTAHHKVLNAAHSTAKEIMGLTVWICGIELLAALKKAHLVIHHKWEHHIQEYSALKALLSTSVFSPKAIGGLVEEVYKLHRAEVEEGVKYPKLNVKKDYFFEDAEFKIFDHDTVHQTVALGSVPAYTLMQDGEVQCSKAKWLQLSDDQKLSCVIEEACVLALERSIIPSLYLNYQFRGARWAYEFALSKICTTITSGWFREYALEHYDQAKAARPDFVNAFFNGIKRGVVKILKPDVVFGTSEPNLQK